MALEIERRFLLSGIPKLSAMARTIEQGYLELPSTLRSLRVRVTAGSSAVITGKEGRGGISREELEGNLDNLKLAEWIYSVCHHKLNKLRLVYQGWEIDIFENPLAGIVLAEKEMTSIDEPFEIPEWLQPYIIREVTDSLTNLHLARLASDLRGTELYAPRYLDSHLKKIPRYVLTGGPCSGKSTLMEMLKADHPNWQFVPEVASIIISQLGILPGKDTLSQHRFQRAIYRTQKLFEETSVEYAISQNKEAVVFDRGSLDGAAYVPGGLEEFIRIIGVHEPDHFRWYDKVVYIAVPTREVYDLNKSNNPARKETYEQAKELGEKIHRAWNLHPSFCEATSDNWEEKVQSVRDALK